jgi:hypothetical protein
MCISASTLAMATKETQGQGCRVLSSRAALANALHQLQRIAEPQTRYVIEERLKEEVDEDGEGGPDDPTRHLHRQARKIRRGDTLDKLTTFLPRQR